MSESDPTSTATLRDIVSREMTANASGRHARAIVDRATIETDAGKRRA